MGSLLEIRLYEDSRLAVELEPGACCCLCRSALPVIQPPVRRRRTDRRRGLDPALVQGFPLYTHDAGKLARGESQTPKTDVPRCSLPPWFCARLQCQG